MEEKARQDSWGKKVSVYFDVLGGGEGGFKIEVSEVNRPKDSIRRDHRIEQNIDTGEGSDKCGGRDGRFKTVAAGGATHTPVDVRLIRPRRAGKKKRRGRPFFSGDGVVYL